MAYQVGDTRRPTLDITPYDGSTVVTLTTVSPSGVATVRALTGPVDTSGTGKWTAASPYTLTEADTWYEQWRATNAVTGLGAGAETTTISVEPTPPPSGTGASSSFATVADYVAIIGGALPDNLPRRLAVASRQIRGEVYSGLYDASAATSIAALKEAACEQAKWASDNGWDSGVPVTQRAVSIGSVSLGATGNSQAGGNDAVSMLAPAVWSILQDAGLIGGPIFTDVLYY